MDALKTDPALRTEIDALRREVERVRHRTTERIDELVLVLAGGLTLIIAAMLVGIAVGRAT